MKNIVFSGISALALAAVLTFVSPAKVSATGCPTYNGYYANGYYSTYCIPSYYPTPIVYTPVYPVYTPVYYQGPRNFYPYYQQPVYTYPPIVYGGGYNHFRRY